MFIYLYYRYLHYIYDKHKIKKTNDLKYISIDFYNKIVSLYWLFQHPIDHETM